MGWLKKIGPVKGQGIRRNNLGVTRYFRPPWDIWSILANELTSRLSIFIRVVIIEQHNIAKPNKLVKSDFILHLKNYQTTCCQVISTSNHVPKVKVSIRKEKFDTAIESLPLIRFPRLCNRFTSTTLSKMIRFGICKDQNDVSHTSQHAEPPGGHIWSHFDWKFQSRRDQNTEFALEYGKKLVFAITLRNQKMGSQIFYML